MYPPGSLTSSLTRQLPSALAGAVTRSWVAESMITGCSTVPFHLTTMPGVKFVPVIVTGV